MSADTPIAFEDAATATLHRFDMHDVSIAQNLNEVMHAAHTRCPVAHSDAHGGYYVVAGYAEAITALTDETHFSSHGGKLIPARQTVEMPPIDADLPEHRQYRRLLNRFFSKTGLARHEADVRETARTLVDRFADSGRAEIVGEFAGPMAGETLCRIVFDLDDPESMTQARRQVEKIANANTPQAWAELSKFVRTLLTSRQIGSSDGLLNAIRDGSVMGRPLTDDEKLGMVTVLFLGGLDTTSAAISCIVHHIATNPGLEERLRTADWTRSELDEFLRHDSVVTALARTVRVDTELGGQSLRAGDRVLVHYYGANHDPAQFPDPDTLDFERGRIPHIAFGAGIHRCLGANLARLQLRVAFEELLSRVRNIRLASDGHVSFTPGVARHPETLPIVFDRC
jgi:cytochrome P450